MNQKNGNQSECGEETPGNVTPFKVKINNAFKRQMSDTSKNRTAGSKALLKRLKLDDDFTNPWRCVSEHYVPLQIKYHKPNYCAPCYFDEKLNKLTKSEKALKIMSYHYALNVHMNIFHQKQPHTVLLGDQIQGSHLFNGSVEKKKPVLPQSDIFPDDENTYISRSGRHVRRRADPSLFEMSDEEEERNNKRVKLEESPKATPVAKKNKKLTNAEIISRSSLFQDSPVSHKSSRTQAIFHKLEETEKEAKKAEVQKSKFEETLTTFSDDEEIDMVISSSQSPNQNEKVESNHDVFTRKRIEPPSFSKKGKSVPTKYTELPSTSSASPQTRDFCNSPTSSPKATNGAARLNPTAKRGPKKKITNCPICGESFPTKEIEQHASTCGLTSELEIESNIPNQKGDHNMLY